MWWVLLALGGLSFLIFFAVLVAGLMRGRGSIEDVPTARPHRLIVLGGVVLPVLVLAAVMVMTVFAMADSRDAAGDEALRIEVVGHQWWWEFRYPDLGVVTANEVHLPVGREVEFRLTSADVIHSFWIPVLGGKLDLLPEDVNTLILEADERGVHRSQCAEFCGLQHAKMGLVAVVERPDEFVTWVRRNRAPAAPPASQTERRGHDVFLNAGCGSCHTVRGTPARGAQGPDLTHLASRRHIAAATLPNTPEALSRWIRDPERFKAGVTMPGFTLPDSELNALVNYLAGLE